MERIERRCPNCHAWNTDEQHCTICGEILDPNLIREAQDEERARQKAQDPVPWLDSFIDGMKNSRWLLVRGLYWLAYSVWFVLMSIVSFILLLVAGTPG